MTENNFYLSLLFKGSPLRGLVILLSFWVTAPLAAQPTKLVGDAIRIVISGSVLELDTPLGTTVTVRFHHEGLIAGDAKELASLLGSAVDRGRWWVANNQLCYKWFRWFNSEPRCMAISQEAKRIYWQRDDGESRTATIVEQDKVPTANTIEVSVVARPAPETNAAHQAGDVELVTTSAAAPFDSRARFVLAEKSPQTMQSPPPVKPWIKIPSPTSVVANVPRPRLAVRPRPPLAAATAPSQLKSQPFVKPDIKFFRVAGVDAFDVLNIRNGPSQDDEPIGEIPPTGQGIIIIGRCSDDWCPIKHGPLTGWVNRNYLEQENYR